MRPLSIRLALAAALLPVFSGVAFASNPLTAEASATKSILSLGESTQVSLSVRLEPGWHVNSNSPKQDFLIPTALEFELPEGVAVTDVEYPEPVSRTLRFLSDQELELYEGTFVIRATISYESLTSPRPLVGLLRYQACNDTVCLRPTMIRVPLGVEAAGADRHAERAGPSAAADVRTSGPSLPFIEFTTASFDEARRSRTPFVIEFAADWCAPCREMRERTFRDATVIEAGSGMTFLSVDMTEPDDFVTRVLASFDVKAAPTTIFFDARGKETLRKGGFIGPEEFARYLQQARGADDPGPAAVSQGA